MPTLAKGFRVGDYELARHVATGVMSEVYEACHVHSGHLAAVKVLSPEWCLDQEFTTRFLNEASALDVLRHPRIVALLASGNLPDGLPFMILEWLPLSLEQALFRAGGAVAERAAARVAAQIAEALSALHARGVVHRDLKPANVLLDQEDLTVATAKLSDLGFAKVPQGPAALPSPLAAAPLAVLPISTGGSEVLGSMDYMAPEQWMRSKDADPRADVYALGVLLFQMLTGHLPFIAEEEHALMMLHLFEPPPLHLLDGLAALATRDLIAQMLDKKPAPRPSMGEVEKRLAGLL
jgi:serine/threonine protein kinase